MQHPALCRLLLLLAAGACGAACAQQGLADLSLEQLTSLEVSSVGKRVQRLADVPASVFVISQEDIRRSGATTLPQVLRLAPNLHVARADANQWAISARGFNSVLANKMLVLVDGRTVYSPLFSGVFWEVQDLLLDDIERIEVLSGAGGTLYGSNAFNGVISIVTRSATETGGTLLKTTGSQEERQLGLRHGRAADDGTSYRLWAKRTLREASETAGGAAIRDAAELAHAGFRADRFLARGALTVQGDLYRDRIEQAAGGARRLAGANVLGRLVSELGDGATAQLQAYVDHVEREQPASVDDTLDTLDIDFQHQSRRGAHELLWGGGWRWQRDDAAPLTAAFRFVPQRRVMRLLNGFVQTEMDVGHGLQLTAGLKAEHNGYTGLEVLPSLRLAWTPAAGQLVWGSLARTVRVPSRIDREFVATPIPSLGGSDFTSEVARVAELGWRGQPTQRLSHTLTLFHHDFSRLRSVDAVAGGTSLNNNFEGRLTGLETWARWRSGDSLRLQAGYVHQRLRLAAVPGSAPLLGTAQLGNDPRYRITAGASLDFGPGMELDLQLRRIGALPNPAVPAYTAVDLRWGWRARPDLELSATVRNLTDDRHAEWGTAAGRAEFRRALVLKAVWRL